MKKYFTSILFVLIVILVATVSCKKNYSSAGNIYPAVERKFRFQLYTNKDFSANTSVINFSLFIRKANGAIFDSSLASMQIKDIPDAAHKLVFEKTVIGNYNLDLAAGFHYEIHDVGTSSYIDTSKAGNTFKIIDFAFQ